MSFEVGESVGHYQIVEEIGAGGNGRVLKVQHLITRRREAMKILSNGRPTSQEYAHRVLREIRLQASLDHPNIAAVLNAFWIEDDLVMVMELIEGQTLQHHLAQRKLSLEHAIHWIRQVLLALTYAHVHGVVHRDISTGNIIVTNEGRIKLTDFGLAKNSADLHVTDSGGMVGSPYYISPEQVRGAAAADHRSDIYSTGIVLYEMVTGTKPFEAESSFLLMQAHVQHKPVPPIERNPAIPQFISDAIMKAVEKNPADRFPTAADFLEALEGPVAAAPAPVEVPKPVAASYSHSYAAALPVEPIEVKPAAKPAKKAFKVPPMVAMLLGIGIVGLAFVPLIVYIGEPSAKRREPEPVVAAPAEEAKPAVVPPVLQAGPKDLPTKPAGDGGGETRRYTARPRVVQQATPPPPPKIVVWGDARTAPAPARVVAPPAAATPTPQKTAERKLEEPPTLQPQQAQPAITPAMPQDPGSTIRRPGILRRLANGVKGLNPVKRDQPTSPPANP